MVDKLYQIKRNPLGFQQAEFSMPLYVTTGWVNERNILKQFPASKKNPAWKDWVDN